MLGVISLSFLLHLYLTLILNDVDELLELRVLEVCQDKFKNKQQYPYKEKNICVFFFVEKFSLLLSRNTNSMVLCKATK